ncbi:MULTISPECIES: TetR/AcrR family transcriptional regulator [Chryseobacterium]|jgi:AcrR family transcriptional regulator|uniref:TetR/AcrR family transcriptional regulator n=3 Tax=Chryseobacterium TaxID=59732 RepID=A0A1N7Q9W7_9FLAO|nr:MULTISPECIES: TetR/AcrR family transcriptional regulator [Chryseobacterium]NPA10570.1 TetR/AcrR family transcriptional regulator [Chlorobiota bacterium]HCR75760.1 TetR/AcrR family transcriptional regulator [Chryseobacterium sp.]MBL7881665.1 TetR/AcrR family transcriptional regulator [Chryseobacterium gambrini]MCF2218277.1 TetR/AcrR family transcriptional regulator [Chryseobacterium sp. PS-8]MCQ4141336.1 TetR/AcrR family transcriptional regulator [Chryseobacterium sp. EO14]
MISKEENILFAAEKLFAEKGFEGTSTREIAKAANVNISMISYYFGSKEKLYEKLVEYRMSEGQFFSKDIIERTDINEWEKVEKIVDQFAGKVRHNKCFYRIMQREQLHAENPQIVEFLKETKMGFISMYSKILESGLQKGIFTKNPPIYLLHSTVSGTLFYASNAKEMYKEFLNDTNEEEVFDEKYYTELNKHIKYLLKDLLGYEENK